MGFKKIKRKGFQLTAHAIIPISKISAITITTDKVKNPIIGNRIFALILTFFWEGNRETLLSKSIEEAKAFAEELKRLVASKEIQPSTSSIADEIAKLSQLTKEGILSEDELTRAKELFLGRPPDNVEQSIQLLRNLKE